MKKFLLPFAALALFAVSCDNSSKGSYSTTNAAEYNLIVDTQNPDTLASVTPSYYRLYMNWSDNTADLTTSNLVIAGKNVSFETKPLPLSVFNVQDPITGAYVQRGMFSAKENVCQATNLKDFSAVYTNGFYSSTIYVPDIPAPDYYSIRLLADYVYNDRYRVRTFWSDCFYMGETNVIDAGAVYSTKGTAYRVMLDFEKRIAKVVLYLPSFAQVEENVPKAIVLSGIPLTVSHDSYSLSADAPKTQIMVTKDGKAELAEPGAYQVSDFRFTLASEDLASANIFYKISGKEVNFSGNSIVKPKN